MGICPSKRILGLLRRLDESGRLALHPPSEIRMSHRAGLLALLKSLEVDRLILDCRPANELEPPLSLNRPIAFELSPSEAAGFRCFGAPCYIPCLKTMAMGDRNAVEIGQGAHLKLALLAGLDFREFVILRGKVPRGDWMIGIIIDDFIALQRAPRDVLGTTMAEKICDMVRIYEQYGLQPNHKKRFRNTASVKFWGIQIDGEQGLLQPQVERS